MPTTVTCPNCGKRGRLPDGFQGRATCPTCRTQFGVEVRVVPTVESPKPAAMTPVEPGVKLGLPDPPACPPTFQRRRRFKYVLLSLAGAPVLLVGGLLAYVTFMPNHIRDGYRARERGDYAEAERHYKIALAKEGDKGINIAREGLALTFQKMGRHQEAVPLLKECVALQEREAIAGGPGWSGKLVYAQLLTNLAASEIALGRWADADPHLEMSLRLEEQAMGPLTGVPSYLTRSQLCRARGLYAEADGFIKRAMDNLINGIGADNIAFAACLEERAALYREWRPDDRRPDVWEESAKAIRSRSPNVPPKDRAGG